MLPPEIDALARTLIPGEGAVTLQPLGTGLFHSTFRAVRDGATYALRVPADGAPIGQDRAWEIRVLKQAARAGLAPPLLYADERSGALLFGWVSGAAWSEAEARQPVAILRMAELLRAIHALPIPTEPRRMDAVAWTDCYTGALAREGLGAAAAFSREASAAIRALADLPGAAPALCHSDLHRQNVLQVGATTAGSSLMLLDWEYAHVTDGYWDLAGWSANNDLPNDAQQLLLETYVGAHPTGPQRARFKLQHWLYDYICLLWIELFVRSRPTDSAAIAPRAAWLERRLRLPVYGTIIG